MNTLRSKYLLHRYLRRTATPQEIDELMDWIAGEDNTEALKSASDEAWAAIEDTESCITDEESDAMLRQVLEHKGAEQAYPEKRQSLIRPRWLKIAAAVAVVAASGLWISQSRRGADSAFTAVAASDIAPGKYNATLTLSNGATIALNNVQNGVVVSQGNSQIIKRDSGELVYRPQNLATGSGRPEAGQVLYNTLSTPRSGQYRVTLPDGSRAWLNASSSIRYPTTFGGKERVIEVTGEVYLEIKSDYRRPFVAKIASREGRDMGSVRVLGTKFNINAYMDESTVKTTLIDGAIRVSKGKAHQLLKPGDQATVGGREDQISVARVYTGDAIAWKNGFFRFRGDDIAHIMNEIARWYDVQVVYKNHKIPQGHYSGVISRNTPLSQVLKILETGGFNFEMTGRKIEVSG